MDVPVFFLAMTIALVGCAISLAVNGWNVGGITCGVIFALLMALTSTKS